MGYKQTKITDKDSAEKFDMKSCILLLIDSIVQQTDLNATEFDINFKSLGKSLNGFKNDLKKQEKVVYCFVGFDSEKTNTYFIVNNPMFNWTDKPDNSSVDVCIQIASNLCDSEKVDKIVGGLIENSDFDYGYITKLPWNFDSSSKRKLKRGLFTISSDVNEIEHAWTFHKLGVCNGFIKRIYPINYLNDSHLKSIRLKELLSGFGTIENVNKDIYKWTLDSNEIVQLRRNEIINEISIITPELGFLKTEKARMFYDKMKLKNGSCSQ